MNKVRVAYFAGCTVNYNMPEVGIATVEILERNGLIPLLTDQKCCGVLSWNSGRSASFRKYAEFNVKGLAETGCDIITSCPTCLHVLKHEYPKILKDLNPGTAPLRIFDTFEYLYTLKRQGALNTDFRPVRKSVSYHIPCHLKAMGNDLIDYRLDLLGSIPGLSITPLSSGCCGMGGTFGLKRNNCEMSLEIGKPLIEEINKTAPDLVATDCLGCNLQIKHITRMNVIHPVLLLREAYK